MVIGALIIYKNVLCVILRDAQLKDGTLAEAMILAQFFAAMPGSASFNILMSYISLNIDCFMGFLPGQFS